MDKTIQEKIKLIALNYNKIPITEIMFFSIKGKTIKEWSNRLKELDKAIENTIDINKFKNIYINYIKFLNATTQAKIEIFVKFGIADIKYSNNYYSAVKKIVEDEKSLKKKIPSKDALNSLANANSTIDKDVRAFASIVMGIFDSFEKQCRTSLRILDKIFTIDNFTELANIKHNGSL